MKASDITDDQIYELVATATFEGFEGMKAWHIAEVGTPSCLMAWDAVKALPQYPKKVVLAKLRQMVEKGRLRGCPCGCRGDFRFPWEEFGFGYEGRENWRERMTEYLKSGKREYGY